MDDTDLAAENASLRQALAGMVEVVERGAPYPGHPNTRDQRPDSVVDRLKVLAASAAPLLADRPADAPAP